MAAGCCGVTGPRHLELRLEPAADDGVEGVLMTLHARGLLHPLAPCLVRSHAGRLPERLLQADQYRRWQGDGLPRRHVHLQPRRQAPSCVERQPVADGMAVDTQPLGDALAAVGWPTGQAIEPRQPWFLATVMCLVSPLLERLRILGHDRDRFAHGRLS
jgi:hypothetical protein